MGVLYKPYHQSNFNDFVVYIMLNMGEEVLGICIGDITFWYVKDMDKLDKRRSKKRNHYNLKNLKSSYDSLSQNTSKL